MKLPLAKERGSENARMMQAEWWKTPKEHARTRIRRNDEKLFTGSQLNWIKGLQVVDKERKTKNGRTQGLFEKITIFIGGYIKK